MAKERVSNSVLHPEAWAFYEEQVRNISGTHLSHLGNYRIPVPDMSGDFIYASTVESLWCQFIRVWYELKGLNAPTVYGKIQYIVENFK